MPKIEECEPGWISTTQSSSVYVVFKRMSRAPRGGFQLLALIAGATHSVQSECLWSGDAAVYLKPPAARHR